MVEASALSDREARDGDVCACGAQYEGGAWWTRVRGLGHAHKPLQVLNQEADRGGCQRCGIIVALVPIPAGHEFRCRGGS